MIRTLIGTTAGAAFILASAMLWLTISTPAHAAQYGLAIYYGAESGNRTANGERFDGTSCKSASSTSGTIQATSAQSEPYANDRHFAWRH